jgi:CubicO group peptidase (beta-lactamase class C family)
MKTSRRTFFAGSAAALSTLCAGPGLAPQVQAKGQDYFPPPDSQGGWRNLTDPARIRKVTGIDVRRLDQAFEYTKLTSKHGGLLVARRGWLVYERYFGRAGREVTPNMASCGKMFTSICCGIMLQEKRDQIPDGLDQKVFTGKYLPGAFPLSDPRKADIKLGHLLAMTSGMWEGRVGIVNGKVATPDPLPRGQRGGDQEQAALRAPMWTNPGGGYNYSTQGVHVASMVLRHIVGKEMQDYIDEKLAKPMQFGGWGYAKQMFGMTFTHTPGGAGIALRATDALRFAYLLLHKGRWGRRQLVPADYVDLCSRPSLYNPHCPYSLQFQVNANGHVIGAPRDAFFKSGAGGFCLYVVPSLDLVMYKMASTDLAHGTYDLGFGAQPRTEKYDESRDTWEPLPATQFNDGPINGDAGTRRALEMVVAAIIE